MKKRYPFLISVPHGGTEVPAALKDRLALTGRELRYYCDPATRQVYAFKDRVAAYIDTDISRMAVDLNRPPLPLPGKDPDGIVKRTTIDGKDVYLPGRFPAIPEILPVLQAHYFPYHQAIDELIDRRHVAIAFDCHSMLPSGSCNQDDAGKDRPAICLGNNGDRRGRAKKNGVVTCPAETLAALADAFKETFPGGTAVTINDPFPGGFIVNAHFWRKGVPWVQVEVNRALYENGDLMGTRTVAPDPRRIRTLRRQVWTALARFWDDAPDNARKNR